MMLESYFAVLIFLAISCGLGLALIAFGYLISIKKPTAAKNAPYECGFDAFENARVPFDVRFYLVAILFIIFDLETAFFFPWAIALRKIGWFGFLSMMLFLSILVLGFIYEWKKGALEWE